MSVRLMARTLRGLEDIAAREIEERGLGTVQQRRHREVWFTARRPDPRLLGLRTVDDLFLLAAVVTGAGHTKADLAAFTRLARAAPLPALLRDRIACGGRAAVTGVDVAASFLGRRNYNRFDIEDAVGRHAATVLGLPYHSRRDGGAPPEHSLSLRVTVEGSEAVLGLRIADRPLHRRPYKQSSTPGTLHPPLAAALAWLAGLRPGTTVVDPCCGTGTILLEAAGLLKAAGHPEAVGRTEAAGPVEAGGATLLGTDHDPATVAAAGKNAATMAAFGNSAAPAGGSPTAGASVTASGPVTASGSVTAGASVTASGSVTAGGAPTARGSVISWAVADAGRMPLRSGAVDRIVSNPPWDRQVEARGALARRPERLYREIRRVLAPGGRAVLLLPDAAEQQALAEAAGLVVAEVRPVSLFGTHPSIVTLTG